MKKLKTKSEELYNTLSNLAFELDEIEEIKNDLSKIDFGLEIEAKAKKDIREKEVVEYEFYDTFSQLYKQCVSDNFYWQYCPASIFEANIPKLIKEYKSYFPDATDNDFLIEYKNNLFCIYTDDEYVYIPDERVYGLGTGQYKSYFFETDFLNIRIDLDDLSRYNSTIYKAIEFSQTRKSEIIDNLLGNVPKVPTAVVENSNFNEVSEDKVIVEDYKDAKYPERFVMLYELGIIDYLRGKLPKSFSNAKLAGLISSFTGDSAENIRTDITNASNDNNKSKLREHNLSKVDITLNKLGLSREMFKKQ